MACVNGEESSAEVTQDNSFACAFGINSKAKGVKNSWIVLAEWENGESKMVIKNVKSFMVDGVKIKEGIFYTLKNGKAVKVL